MAWFVEQFVFYFLLVAIPFQTRKILYFSGWYFNEWQSISLYATDILLLIVFGFWIYNHKEYKFKIAQYDLFLFAFIIFAAVSVFRAPDIKVSLFQFIKIIEFSAFYFYLKNYAIKRFKFGPILKAIVLGGFFQALIAIAQFLKQSDLGLKYFGESILSPAMTGVAAFYNSAGDKIMRSYGTTPHPNVVAAFILLSAFAFIYLAIYEKNRLWYYFGYSIMLFGLFYTFSRTVVGLWVLGVLLRSLLIIAKKKYRLEYWNNKTMQARLKRIFVFTIIPVILFAALYWPYVMNRAHISSGDEAVRLRVFYNGESLKAGINWFGIGLGGFVPWLMTQDTNLARNLYQPVHNIYLLIYTENGIMGIFAFGLFLIFLLKNFIRTTKMERLKDWSFLILASSFLVIGAFDHFLWTLQEGRFMLWLMLGLLSVAGEVS